MKDCFEHFLNTSTQYLISQDTLSSQSNSKVPIPRIRHPLTHNVIIHSQCNVYTYVCTYTITARVLTDNYYVPLIWYHSNTWIGLQEIWKMELRSSITRVVDTVLTLAGKEECLLQFDKVYYLFMGGTRQCEAIHTNYLVSRLDE